MEGSGSAPSSTAVCPACGKGVDPLRAGHVAIMGGAFRYFCDAECKRAYVADSARGLALSAMTAEPPAVRSAVRAQERPALPESTPAAPPVSSPAPSEAATSPSPPSTRAALEEPPRTLRSLAEESGGAPVSAAAAPVVARSPRRPLERERATRGSPLLTAAGVAAGVLAAVVPLAGESAARARLPLALFAVVTAVSWAFGGARSGASSRARWMLVVPIVVAGVVSAIAAGRAGADARAIFVGLAAAAVLAIDALVARASRDVHLARQDILRGLSGRGRVQRGDLLVEIDASQVRPGDVLVLAPGDVVVADGVVAKGRGELAPWFESPVVTAVREGDAVVAGATVISGELRITASLVGPERAWLRPTALGVEAPLVVAATRLVELGAPACALLVAGAIYAVGASWPDVLVAACGGATALGAAGALLASGAAHTRGQLIALRRGIAYRDARAFDAAARAGAAVLCARGTVLLGEPEIVTVQAITKAGKTATADAASEVLALAAGAELASPHPFAGAVVREAAARGIDPARVRSALDHPGLGVTALTPSGDKLIVGSRGFLVQERVSVAVTDVRVSELEGQGRSVLLVAVSGKVIGFLALQDGLRPGARAAIHRLHTARVEPVLLSGEARETCEAIARSLDVEHVRAEVLPADRAAEVRALADGGQLVATIGHPSSDDGALRAADVSVAMRAAGAVPLEWGVALASDDVRDAVLALTVPRACRERARTAALAGALAHLGAALVIGFGLAPPAIAPVIGFAVTAFALSWVRDPVDDASSRA